MTAHCVSLIVQKRKVKILKINLTFEDLFTIKKRNFFCSRLYNAYRRRRRVFFLIGFLLSLKYLVINDLFFCFRVCETTSIGCQKSIAIWNDNQSCQKIVFPLRVLSNSLCCPLHCCNYISNLMPIHSQIDVCEYRITLSYYQRSDNTTQYPQVKTRYRH